MARLAAVRRDDVGGALPRGFHAVVAAHAAARYTRVIEVRWRPRHCGMASAAFSGGRDVIGIFPSRSAAVVARRASAGYLRVVHARGWLPCSNDVARLAAISRSDVGGILACGARSVVAAHAIA